MHRLLTVSWRVKVEWPDNSGRASTIISYMASSVNSSKSRWIRGQGYFGVGNEWEMIALTPKFDASEATKITLSWKNKQTRVVNILYHDYLDGLLDQHRYNGVPNVSASSETTVLGSKLATRPEHLSKCTQMTVNLKRIQLRKQYILPSRGNVSTKVRGRKVLGRIL